jgi:hypothetical protein
LNSFLAFLLPLSIYLLALGLINRRHRPLMVAGTWDFAGLLFAASGFLFFGGPAILSLLNERWRIAWLFSPRRTVQSLSTEGYHFWLLISILYFVAVVAGSAYLIWRRRDQVAIYNVDAPAFDEALAQTLDRLSLSWTRSGQYLLIGYASPPAKTADPNVELLNASARIELDAAPLLRHVTLSWEQVDPPLRREIESELAHVLAQTYTRFNPLGLWLLLLSAFLFCVIFFVTLLAVVLPVIAQP